MPTSGITLWYGPDTFVKSGANGLNGNNSSFLSRSNADVNLNGSDWTILVMGTAGVLSSSGTIFKNLMGKNFQSGNQASYIIYRIKDNGAGTDKLYCQISRDGTLGNAAAVELGNVVQGSGFFASVRYDSANGILYGSVDGAAENSIPYATGAFACNEPLEIGRSERTNAWVGIVQAVLIEKRLMDLTDISWARNSGAGRTYDEMIARSGFLNNIVGFWACNDANSNSLAIDISVNGRHMIRNNAPAVASGGPYQAGLSQWTDGGSAGANATPSTATHRPTVLSYHSNNHPNMMFDGVGSKLNFTATNMGKVNHIIFVWEWHGTALGGLPSGAIIANASSPQEYGAYIDQTKIYYKPNGASFVSVNHLGKGQDILTVFEIRRSHTSVTFYQDGEQIGATQTLDADNDLTLSTIGCYSDGGSRQFESISEIRCWANKVLSNAERGDEYEYLNTEYGFDFDIGNTITIQPTTIVSAESISTPTISNEFIQKDQANVVQSDARLKMRNPPYKNRE